MKNILINLQLFPGTGVSTVRDLKGTGDITTRRLVIDMDETIVELEPDSQSLLILLSKLTKKRMVTNSEFDWQEDEYTPFYGDIDGTQAASATWLLLDSTMFRVNDIVVVPSNSSRTFIVTANNIGTKTITVAPTDGGANMGVTDTYKIARIGNAHEEGDTKRDILSTQPGIHDNYCQIFRTPFGATETLKSTDVYGGMELDKDRTKAGVEHSIEIQKAFLFGQQAKIVTGTHPKRMVGGIVPRIQTNVNDLAGVPLTETLWEAWMEMLFDKGSDEKIVFASSKIYAQVSTFASGKLQMVPKDKTYGIHIEEYLSPHGTVFLINGRKFLDEEPWKSMAIGLDMVNLRYVALKNRDTKLKTNIQANDEDSEIDEYLSEISVEVKLEETHSVMEDVG